MFKSPGLVGRVGSGISSLASVLGGAAAAAATYLLRALFGGANQALADTDVLTDEKGDLTVKDDSSGVVKIVSGALQLDGFASTYGTGVETGSTAVTRVAGKKLIVGKISLDNPTSASLSAPYFALNTSSAGSTANEEATIQMWTVDGSGASWRVSDSNDVDMIVQGGVPTDFTADFNYGMAQVLGGFTSGVPSASGTEGVMSFWYDGTNWILVSAMPDGSTSSLYPHYVQYDGGANLATWDDLIIPTAADTSVFTPTGYALDTFTDSNGTTVTSHTTNTGQSWTEFTAGWDAEIQGNAATNTTGSASLIYGNLFDCGISDLFLTVDHTVGSTSASGANGWTMYRYTDDNNYWTVLYSENGGSDSFILREKTGGSNTDRASATPSIATDTTYKMSIRASGTSHEAWWDGGNKLSYTSASHQTATTVGFLVRNLTVNSAKVDNLYVLPLTSATYDTAFDTSALTADDCDLYHTFDSIGDVTFANGAVIRDGYVEDGALVIVDSGGAALSIDTNRLEVTGNGTSVVNSGFYGGSFTPAAGMVYVCDLTRDVGTAIELAIKDAGAIAAANDYFTVGEDGSPGIYVQTAVGGASYRTYYIADTGAQKFALVLGGFDSSGVPSASGTYGCFGYYYDGANWVLIASDDRSTLGTAYPTGRANPGDAAKSVTWDTIKLPDSSTTVESVFTPTGYARDSFTDSNGTNITSHTLDSGGSWSLSGDDQVTIQSNKAEIAAKPSAGAYVSYIYKDHGDADCFITAKVTKGNDVSVSDCRMNIRHTDTNNHWTYGVWSWGSSTWALWEVTGGSATSRANFNKTVVDGTTYQKSVRANGQTIECWLDGGDKISYASATSHLTETQHGVAFSYSYGTTPCTQGAVDNYYFLPLTSDTYADLDF